MQAVFIGWQSHGTAQARPPQDAILGQHFVCNTGYTLEKCQEELSVLRKVVAQYPTATMGEWTWVLVRSQDWQGIARQLRLDPNSPAFTCLETRATFIEEALVGKVAGGRGELVAKWQMGMDSLLDLAVRHELGHVLCNQKNEAKAGEIAEMLQERKRFSCEPSLAAKDRSKERGK